MRVPLAVFNVPIVSNEGQLLNMFLIQVHKGISISGKVTNASQLPHVPPIVVAAEKFREGKDVSPSQSFHAVSKSSPNAVLISGNDVNGFPAHAPPKLLQLDVSINGKDVKLQKFHAWNIFVTFDASAMANVVNPATFSNEPDKSVIVLLTFILISVNVSVEKNILVTTLILRIVTVPDAIDEAAPATYAV